MPEVLSDAVAEVIRELCAARSWSGRELARQTGLSAATLAGKLTGGGRWTVDDVDAVAAVFGLRPDDLLAMAARRRDTPTG